MFFNSAGQAVYMTAALGVILNQSNNTQKFFGGGQVDMKAKNVSDDTQCHTDDITAIAISSDRRWAASGQVGSAPACFVWDAQTGQKKQRFKLAKGARGVDAIGISGDGSTVALVDRHDKHNVYVFNIDSGAGSSQPSGGNKIFDLQFSAAPGDNTFATVGSKHIKFWDPSTISGNNGVFGTAGEMTSFACAAYDNQGTLYTGGANSMIYVWGSDRKLASTTKAHTGGFISAMRWNNGKLYSGGKDG